VAEPFLDQYLPYVLQRTDQLLSARFVAELRRRDVEVSEWRVLAVLREVGPSSVAALSERILLPQPTTSHAVSRLAGLGLVRRTVGEHDGRQRIVTLTPAGRRRASELVAAAGRALDRTLADTGIDIDPSLLPTLSALIERLHAPPPDA
jgi:DNA-binding MarR family transcriptional regulator